MNPSFASVRCVYLCLALAAFAFAAVPLHAAEPPTIINTGEAEIFAPIGQVEFRFIRHFIGETLEASLTECETFIKAAPQAIRGSELQPVELRTAPPLVTSMADRQARAEVVVRFGMAAFSAPKTGPTQFAALCDKMAALAVTMNATLAPPLFQPADKDAIEAAAVARAAENAYPPSEAIAHAVKSAIFAINSVELLELNWEQQPEKQLGDVPQMACRAKVRVTYALSAQ